MKRLFTEIQFLCCIVCFVSVSFFADDDCPADMECITVVGQLPSCPEGASCSREIPEQLAIDCYMELVGYPEAEVSSLYGEERPDGPHNGIDLAVPTGTDVFAAKKGTVFEVVNEFKEGDRSTPNGNYVRIKYHDGTEGAYIHLLKTAVVNAQEVDAGDKIGESNDTGKSSGPHLHYTQYTDFTREETVDPAEIHSDC